MTLNLNPVHRMEIIMSNMNKKEKTRGQGLGIFPKLLLSILTLSIIPLIVLGYMANKNMAETGSEAIAIARGMGARNLGSAREMEMRPLKIVYGHWMSNPRRQSS
jgi:hypothetical protein